MKKLKTILTSFIVTLLSAAFILPLAACDKGGQGEIEGTNAVYVTSSGGMALKDVTVELFKDTESLGSKKTDEEGKVSYTLNSGVDYTAKVTDLPAGFHPEASYTVKGSDATTYIRINSEIIDGTPTKPYATGDVMYDFEQTYYTYNSETKSLDNTTKKLSDFFAEGKKAVLINMFYNTCSACVAEYPALSGAYKKYADKIAVLGINDYPETHPDETLAKLQALIQRDQVPYLMCKDKAGVGTWFTGISQGLYPTSIMIDRYGILCETMVGNNTTQSFWEDWFETYTSDDYTPPDIKPGDPTEVFTPDVPGDFGATMPSTQTINSKINNTGRNVIFSADPSNTSSSWPWDLTEDQSAIYPTNSGHKGTFAIIYAQIDLNAGEVFAFDYKLSTYTENDYFYVSLDSRQGTGRQLSMVSGVQDWQTGFAYVALEKGRHEIEFTYYRSTATTNVPLDDKVYIKNLRITDVEEMNAALTAKQETLEIPYFATRNYNNDIKQFENIDDVYLAADGYYHIGTAAEAKDSDPYLLLDLTHSTPYFGSNANSLYTLITENKAKYGGMIINGKDYTDKFDSYVSYSTNSLYEGMIPVTTEIRNTITALYNDAIPSDRPYWSEKGWLQFCVSYRQYGVQKELTDPVKGLAYFSAFEAKETTGLESYVKVEKGTGQFIFDETKGIYVDVEGTSKENEGDYNLNDGINQVYFDRIIMPRGYLYKFVPTKSGAYRFSGLDCYYLNEDGESVVDGEETDAYLYGGDLDISHSIKAPIAFSDSDRIYRNEDASSFRINYYLEANKTYYLSVNFRVVETTGNFSFRIDYLGETYSYLDKTCADYYIPDENGKIQLPLYAKPVYDSNEDVWRDENGGLIYVDFTGVTSFFNPYTIEDILDDSKKTSQFTFDMTKEKYIDKDGKEHDISLDLEKMFGGAENIPEPLRGVEIKDYTEIMRNYLAKSKEVGQDSEFYGLVPVNNELYGILQLFNAKFIGYDTDYEWLKACWYTVNLGPEI